MVAKPYFDKAQGKMVFPEPEKQTGNGVDKTGIAISNALLARLHKVIQADGFKPDAKDEKGRTRQLNRMARITIEGVVEKYLEGREAVKK